MSAIKINLKDELVLFLRQADNQINLAEAALMVAKIEYPQLNVQSCLQQIQQMADEILKRLPDTPNAGETLNQLNQVLFVEKGFTGNSEHYYDARNSFLNDVLERKKGMPISLSILYLYLGELLKLPLSGVAFPGHFLIKLDIDDGAIVLDPYYGGISLSEENVYERLQDFYGDKAKNMSVYGLLETCKRRDIIVRLIRNLRNIYMHDKLWGKALNMADIMVGVGDDMADAIKSRAAIYDKLECSGAALKDYQQYMDISPNADDNMQIRSRVIQLSQACRQIN